MFGPLHEAFEVKCVFAYGGAGCSGIASDDLHVADSAEVVFIFVLLLNYYISSWHLDLCVFKKIRKFVVVNTTVCYDVAQFFIGIKVFEEERMVKREVEYISEDVESVEALSTVGGRTRTLELVAYSDLEFCSENILQNKAGSTCDTNQIKLLQAR